MIDHCSNDIDNEISSCPTNKQTMIDGLFISNWMNRQKNTMMMIIIRHTSRFVLLYSLRKEIVKGCEQSHSMTHHWSCSNDRYQNEKNPHRLRLFSWETSTSNNRTICTNVCLSITIRTSNSWFLPIRKSQKERGRNKRMTQSIFSFTLFVRCALAN